MKRGCIIVAWLLSLGSILEAQPADQQTVESALSDIEDHYQVRFSYSKDIVPHDDLVVLGYEKKSLVEVLEDLGSQTGIVYRQRGTRVVLNYNPALKNPKVLAASKSIPMVQTVERIEQTPVLVLVDSHDDMVETTREKREVQSGVVTINDRNTKQEIEFERNYEAKGLRVEKQEERQWAQVSVLPLQPLGGRKSQKINHFSFNLLAGYTGGLEGIEIGAFANGIKRDVKGMQLAGFVNYVGGNVEGGQVAGFGNFNKGIIRGIQVAGMTNINEQADGVLIAGGFNLNRRISRGYQLAGFFNAGRNIAGGQVAGFLNVSMGNAYFQASGFCNVAENIDVQLSGLVNVAKEVRGFQIGLINVADTVGEFSFGLLNLIKRGYNKIEFSVGDALYGNVAVKLGTRKFYNIFQVGTNFQRNLLRNGYTWGYGYGFGFFQKISREFKLNPEVLVSNVQEKKVIKPDLNLLSQLKLFFHFTEGSRVEVFAGPTANFMISKLSLNDGSISGSQIAPYTLFENNYFGTSNNPISTKFWIGFNAGVRI
ncbi:MAG: hypothetical protein HKN76_11520 [Saprospiraceae bacterium]|nr:hypothetical protein [Saprospiraceae bacterium]